MSTYSAVPVRAPVARWSASTPPGTLQTFVASDEATDTEAADESLWYGTPVFDASHWHAKGGLALVRAMHAKLGATVEALIIQCAGDELGWPWECLALSWPNVNTVDISCDVSSVEADAQVLRWLGLVQDHVLFPLARLYRLTARWAGCTEVFEHPLRDDIDIELDKRLLLLRNLPSQICSSPQETCFYMYRAMFLVSVEFDMSTMAKTNSGALAMYTYISYLLKTDVFSPHSIGLTGAKPSHLQSILAKISENSHKLTYDRMRVSTGNLALQFSLKVLSLDLYCMTEGRHTIPFCAAHFPQLESLVINHSPDFKGGRDDPMNLGVLFRLPWPRLVDLQLPFISDDYARLLLDKCPNLRFLHVCPEPRYERWTAYAQTFTPKALHTIATQWHTLRQLVVSYAFRQGLQPSDLGTATASPSRLSFSGTRMSTFSSRASVIGSSLSPLSIETFASSGNSNSSGKPQMPGLQPCDSFPIRPPSNSLRVLHLPYLQLSFSAGLALLADAPQLQILEFSYFIKDTEPATPSIAATLRRRVAPSPALPLNAPFADPDVVYRIRSMRHQLQNLILREACTTRFISSSWIEIMNMFAQLEAVTFVANKQEDIAVAARLIQFCNRNNARFGVKVDDQSRSYQTCIDFANSWDKSGKLLWSSQ
ncbi:hypothetical protein H4R26_000576 [Coemansia thaxteri]|uniref:Uncharacterized protein n=1 Tax=Coemansia thaxteri TaxID=2663907 RepID=A0A9W8EK15_9FUNG|nr:hypothetical protein H4R26_000576 [Coemansia thaxteri]KAJ2486236.1 hypothetical protein EV174_001256 [Coemansia sp. RSA 2320]